jgi:hypothetical protein
MHNIWGDYWDTMLQDGRSRVRFPIRSLNFLIGVMLAAALWPWGRLRIEYQESSSLFDKNILLSTLFSHTLYLCRIWGSHSGGFEVLHLLGFNAVFRTCFILPSYLAYSSTLKMKAIFSSETPVDFSRLHGVVSQKIELFTLSLCSSLNVGHRVPHPYKAKTSFSSFGCTNFAQSWYFKRALGSRRGLLMKGSGFYWLLHLGPAGYFKGCTLCWGVRELLHNILRMILMSRDKCREHLQDLLRTEMLSNCFYHCTALFCFRPYLNHPTLSLVRLADLLGSWGLKTGWSGAKTRHQQMVLLLL